MAPRQRIVLLLIAAVVLVAGIALAAGTGGDEDPTAGTPPRTGSAGVETTAAGEKPTPPPAPRVDTLRIRGGKAAGGQKKLRYESGDTIALRLVADASGEVHIHGFDKYVQVGTSPKITRFKADREGIFEVEEHGSGEILATLEIRPK